MSKNENEMNGNGGLKWESVAKWAKWFVTCAVAITTVVVSGGYHAATVIQEFRSHAVESERRDAGQDMRLDGHDAIFSNHETRIDGVELTVAQLGPAAAQRKVETAISLVQDAIDCATATGNESDWVPVPGASSNYLPDELRVRVEEHFRRLGYEVSRERQLPTGRSRCFWIFVRQSDASTLLLLGREYEENQDCG